MCCHIGCVGFVNLPGGERIPRQQITELVVNERLRNRYQRQRREPQHQRRQPDSQHREPRPDCQSAEDILHAPEQPRARAGPAQCQSYRDRSCARFHHQERGAGFNGWLNQHRVMPCIPRSFPPLLSNQWDAAPIDSPDVIWQRQDRPDRDLRNTHAARPWGTAAEDRTSNPPGILYRPAITLLNAPFGKRARTRVM